MSSSVFRVSGAEGELGVSVVSSLGFKGTLRHGVESFGLAACGVKFAGCSFQWSMFKLSLKLRNPVAAKPSPPAWFYNVSFGWILYTVFNSGLYAPIT